MRGTLLPAWWLSFARLVAQVWPVGGAGVPSGRGGEGCPIPGGAGHGAKHFLRREVFVYVPIMRILPFPGDASERIGLPVGGGLAVGWFPEWREESPQE